MPRVPASNMFSSFGQSDEDISPQVPFGMDKPSEELLGSLKRLYANGDYSDLTIVCNGKHYEVHKCIICPRSEFFAAACRGGFKEAREGKISLPDDDPVAVDLMIWYFYHLDYEVRGTGGPTARLICEAPGEEISQLPPCQSAKVVIDSDIMVHAVTVLTAGDSSIDLLLLHKERSTVTVLTAGDSSIDLLLLHKERSSICYS
ncbi:hypothetical protein F5X97DRAFT_220570 [Nemania serpens]|nr:hypothetical protein F5X97DRAFT_220570 [Nemania serpens]